MKCWCGAAGTDVDKHGTSSACTRPCSGDGSVTCGGYFAFQLYDNPTPKPTPAPTPAPTTYASFGCFADKKNDRVLTNMMKSNKMTYEVSMSGRHHT